MNKHVFILVALMYSLSASAMNNPPEGSKSPSVWQSMKNSLPVEMQAIICNYILSDADYKRFVDAVCRETYQVLKPGFSSLATSTAIEDAQDLVVAGFKNGAVVAWNIHSKKVLHVWNTKSEIVSVAISSNGTRIASGSVDGSVRVYDSKTGKELFLFNNTSVKKVGFTKDGRKVIIGSNSYNVNYMDIETKQEACSLTTGLPNNKSTIYSPGGKIIIIGSSELNDAPPIQIFRSYDKTEFMEKYSWQSSDARAVATDVHDTMLAIAFGDIGVRVWHISNQDELLAIDGKVNGLMFSYINNELITMHPDKLKVWDLSTGACKYTFSASTTHHFSRKKDASLTSFMVGRENTMMVVSDSAKGVYLWDLGIYKKIEQIVQLKPILPEEINPKTDQDTVCGRRRALWRAYFIKELVDAYTADKKLVLDSYGKDGKGGFKYLIYTKFFTKEYQELLAPFISIKKPIKKILSLGSSKKN